MTKLKMSDKVELTLQELQDLFIAGQRFGRDYLLYETELLKQFIYPHNESSFISIQLFPQRTAIDNNTTKMK